MQVIDRALALIDEGQAAAAVKLLAHAVEHQPGDADAWFVLGRAHGALDRHADAEMAFRKAAELRPTMREAQVNLAFSRVNQGRFREAIAAFVAAREMSPGDRSVNDVLMFAVLSALQDDSAANPAASFELGPLRRNPLISVIIPTRDRPGMLRDALASVMRQTYGNWEVILVNDGGQDVSAVLASLPAGAASRIASLELRLPQGVARARNSALPVARGEVIAFLDDDDLFLPEHLDALVEGMRGSGAAFAYTRSAGVEEQITNGARVEVRRGAPLEYRYSRSLLLVRNLIPTANWGVRRECLERCGGFDDTLACAEDWDMLLRLSALVPFHLIPAVTAEIRARPGALDSVTRRVPLRPTCELLYRRYPSNGNKLIELGRAVYMESVP